MKHIQIQKKRVLATWLISYLIIFTLPLLFSILSYVQTEAMLREEVYRTNLTVLKNSKTAIDMTTRAMKGLAQELAMNKRLQTTATYQAPLTGTQRYSLRLLALDLAPYCNSNSNIDNLYIYFPRIEMIVGGNFAENSDSFYHIHYGMPEEEHKTWKATMQMKDTFDYYLLPYRKLNGETGQYLSYIFSVRDLSDGTLTANIVVEMDTESIAGTLDEQDGFVVMDLEHNTVVSSTTSKAFTDALKHMEFNSGQGEASLEVDGHKLMVTYMDSEENRWRYVYFTERDKYLKQISISRWTTILILCVCFISGYLLIYYLLKKNYSPVKDLTEVLSKNGSSSLSGDEWGFIKDSVVRIVREKMDAEDQLEDQKKVLKNEMLIKLFEGRDISTDSFVRAFRTNFGEFNRNCFMVITFYIESLEGIFFEEMTSYDEKDYLLAQTAIENVTSELMNLKYPCVMVKSGKLLAALINVDSAQDKSEVFILLDDSKQILLDNFNVSYLTAAGDVHLGIKGIAEAYKEAYERMEYKLMEFDDDLDYDEIRLPENETVYYPFEKEYQLMNFVKAGNFEKSNEILQNVFEMNIQRHRQSLSLVKYLIFDLANTLIKTVNDISPLEGEKASGMIGEFEKLFECGTVSEMKEELEALLRSVCAYIAENKTEVVDVIAARTEQYIADHYKEQELSVATIADAFHMNSSYLSSAFKQQSGTGLLEYINKYRVNAAKELMKDRKLTIERISGLVGYTNVRTFIRVFHRHEGMSPGKYREILD